MENANRRADQKLKYWSSRDTNSWDVLEIAGNFMIAATLIVLLQRYFEDKLSWHITLTPQFALAFPFSVCIVGSIVLVNAIYQTHGVFKAVLCAIPGVFLCVSVLYLPPLIWADKLVVSYGTVPTVLVALLHIGIWWAISKFAKQQSRRTKNKELIQIYNADKSQDIETLNQIWFTQLQIRLRTSYYYSSTMLAQTISSLKTQLANSSEDGQTVSAQEHFGSVKSYAKELAEHNLQATKNRNRYNLLGVLFTVTILSMCTGTAVYILLTDGSSIPVWLTVLIATPLNLLYFYYLACHIKAKILTRLGH